MLVSQLSLIVARVARVEYPTRMSNLLDVFLHLLSSQDSYLVYQGMYGPLSLFILDNPCCASFAPFPRVGSESSGKPFPSWSTT